MSEKKRLTKKLKGSLAVDVVGLLITTFERSIAESASEKRIKFVNTWQSCKQEGGCLVHFLRLATTLLIDEEITRHLKYGEKQLLLTIVTSILTLP